MSILKSLFGWLLPRSEALPRPEVWALAVPRCLQVVNDAEGVKEYVCPCHGHIGAAFYEYRVVLPDGWETLDVFCAACLRDALRKLPIAQLRLSVGIVAAPDNALKGPEEDPVPD